MDRSLYVHAIQYTSNDVNRYADKAEECPEYLAFLLPYMKSYLKSEVPGKRVLDIGCGKGIWCRHPAECGAKSVDGLDLHEEMVQLAKQTTSQFNNVTIHHGDLTNMPYGDEMFDVALSIYITLSLRPESCIKLFKEIYRILVPGGKAVVNCVPTLAFEKLILRSGADKVAVEEKITKTLMKLTSYPSQDEVNEAFQDLNEVIEGHFALNVHGQLERVTDVNKLSNGQAVWCKCQIMTFATYFYNEHFYQQHIEDAGLKIDKVENYYTEEKMITYNNTSPEVKFDKMVTDMPPFVMYHLSKKLINAI